MTADEADNIYDLLIFYGGADGMVRDEFARYMVGRPETGGSGEWRFQGRLGFGGKFYVSAYGWRVDCYPEDLNPERKLLIERLNRWLARIRPTRRVTSYGQTAEAG